MKKSIFLIFAAILCTMSAWALNQSNVDLYFDNSTAQWESCNVYIGHGSYTSCYAMKRVSGTQYLWKLAAGFNSGNSWDNASGWVVSKDNWWASSYEDVYKFVYHGNKNVTNIRTSAWSANTIYKAEGTQSVNHYSTDCTVYKWTTSTKSDYKVTINAVTGGTLTVKDYDNATVSNGASKIKLTVLKFSATPASGYVFDGVQINNGSTTTTYTAADVTSGKTYTLTSAVTITPVWKATTSTVTVTATATNGTVIGGGVVEEGTSVTLTATPADGYKFVNWTVGGAEVSTANPYTFTADADITVTANFEELPKITLYFVDSKKWGSVNCHHWENASNATTWPGDPMTKVDAVHGFDIYKISYANLEHKNCIFNGGGKQTSDLVAEDGKYYYPETRKWYATIAEIPAPDPLATDVYLKGGWNEWAGTEFKKAKADATTATITLNLAARAEYEFKVERQGVWTSSKDNRDIKASVSGLVFSKDINDNTKMTTIITGDYVFTWDINQSQLSIDYPELEYIVAGSEEIFGSAWKKDDESNKMAKQTNGTYTLTKTDIHLAENTQYSYRVSQNGQYYLAINEDKNYEYTPDKSGIYEVTFTLSADLSTLTSNFTCVQEEVVIADCFIAGNKELVGGESDDWQDSKIDITSTFDETTKNYSYTFTNLSANTTYEMKVVCGDWYGFDKLSAVPTGVIKGTDNRIAFQLAEDGNVTVTYNATTGITLTGNFQTPTLTFTVYVPKGTEKCYICGEWDWHSFKEMTPVSGSESQYTITIPGSLGNHGYKYTCGTSWDYEEVKSDGNLLDENRTWKVIDYVADWKSLQTDVYLAGEMTDWDAGKKRFKKASKDATTASITIELTEVKTYQFKIIKGEEWVGNNGEFNSSISGWDFPKQDGDGNCKMTISYPGYYTFTWDINNSKLSVTYPEMVEKTLTFENWNMQEFSGRSSYTEISYIEDGADWATHTLYIYNYADGEFKYEGTYDIDGTLQYNGIDINVAGTGHWTVVDGVGSLENAILVGYTKDTYYKFTVSVTTSSIQTFTVECVDATVTEGEYGEIIFEGTADDKNLYIESFTDFEGNAISIGTWGSVEFSSTEYEINSDEDGSYLSGTYYDDNGNIYEVSVMAPTVEPTAIIAEAVLTWEGSNLKMVADWEDWEETVTVILNNFDASVFETTYSDLTVEIGTAGDFPIVGDATATIEDGELTLEGSFVYEDTGMEFEVLLWGTIPTTEEPTTITLTDGDNRNVITNNTDQPVNVIVNRAFEEGDEWYTLCVPFDMLASTIGEAYQLSGLVKKGADYVEVNLAKKTTIEAGQPYLIKPSVTGDKFVVDNVTIVNTTGASITKSISGLSVTMQGVINGLGTTTGGLYWVGDGGYLYNDDVNELGLRTYFSISTSSGIAPRLRVVAGENVETGVEDLYSTDAPVKVLENGQLIIIRDDVKYNAQGQVIK